MIAYIRGTVAECLPTHVLVETGGLAYHVHISLYTYSKINGQNQIKILTHLITREDGQTLFGFASEEERSLFIHLISVSGVGPNTARVILSSMEPETVRQTIVTGEDTAFRKVKGVGPKTAQRIIVDLKDKLSKDLGFGPIQPGSSKSTKRSEAQSALLALGFGRAQIDMAIQKLPQQMLEEAELEQIIKEVLKNLG
ncbi:MAG: Holliday junction branch migration protein RuvA [Saprospiraceae bacterium]|nr:Holliday junction branch migration protein RuvA [Saprospiraceae bacterium]